MTKLQTASSTLRRHSRAGGNPDLWDSGNIQRLAEALKILDSRFHGNDEVSDGIVHSPPSFPRRRESRPSGGGNIQRLAEALKILDSRFRGNDGRLRE